MSENACFQQLQKKRALPPTGRGRNGYGWRAILAVLAGHGANAVLVSEAPQSRLAMGDNCQDGSVTIPTIPEHF